MQFSWWGCAHSSKVHARSRARAARLQLRRPPARRARGQQAGTIRHDG
jgi:hypothetical protein